MTAMMQQLGRLIADKGDIARAMSERWSAMRTVLLIWLCLVLAMFSGIAFADLARTGVREEIETILSEQDYQRTLPKSPTSLKIKLPKLPGLELVLEMLSWVVAAVVVILLASYLYGLASRSRWPKWFSGHDSLEAADGGATHRLGKDGLGVQFEEIEQLAREGRFGEAVHLILLRCFEVLRQQSSTARDAALTSREVLARATLTAQARASLAFIVSAVEVGHFGGQEINRSVYQQCLDRYRVIAATDTP